MKFLSFNIVEGEGPKVTMTEKRSEELTTLCATQTAQRTTFTKNINDSKNSNLIAEWNKICDLRREINEKFEEGRILAVGEANEGFLKAVNDLLEKLENAPTEELLTSDNYVLRQIGKRIQKG